MGGRQRCWGGICWLVTSISWLPSPDAPQLFDINIRWRQPRCKLAIFAPALIAFHLLVGHNSAYLLLLHSFIDSSFRDPQKCCSLSPFKSLLSSLIISWLQFSISCLSCGLQEQQRSSLARVGKLQGCVTALRIARGPSVMTYILPISQVCLDSDNQWCQLIEHHCTPPNRTSFMQRSQTWSNNVQRQSSCLACNGLVSWA